jgi:hypothetical protein
MFSIYKKMLSMTEEITLSFAAIVSFMKRRKMYDNLKVTPQALIDLRIR